MRVFTAASGSYFSRAKVLFESVRNHSPEASLSFTPLDSAALARASELGNVEIVDFDRLVKEHPDKDKNKKSFSETIFTYMPALVRTSLSALKPGEWLIYLDSDILVTENLQRLVEDAGDFSVVVFPHSFTNFGKRMSRLYGSYNAGAVAVRNDENGHNFLIEWFRLAMLWCFDRPDNGRYAHQAYLDELRNMSGVTELDSAIYNRAPWNSPRILARHKEEPWPVFYHFQGFRSSRGQLASGHFQYLTKPSNLERRLYEHYCERIGAYIFADNREAGPSPRDSGMLRLNFMKQIALFYSRVFGFSMALRSEEPQ